MPTTSKPTTTTLNPYSSTSDSRHLPSGSGSGGDITGGGGTGGQETSIPETTSSHTLPEDNLYLG